MLRIFSQGWKGRFSTLSSQTRNSNSDFYSSKSKYSIISKGKCPTFSKHFSTIKNFSEKLEIGKSHNNLISELVHKASNLLPHQPILENFIHHNPLKELEYLNFKDALEYIRNLNLYMSPGERILFLTEVNPTKRVNEALADLSSIFLDRGASKWSPSFRHNGFLYFFASLEGLGVSNWRAHARQTAKEILDQLEEHPGDLKRTKELAELIIEENLKFFGIKKEEWELAIRSMLNELKGWAGMFERMETHKSEAPQATTVRLIEFCAVQSILNRSSIVTVAHQFGWDEAKMPFHQWINEVPTRRQQTQTNKSNKNQEEEETHTSSIAFLDQNSERREMLEMEFEKALLQTLTHNHETSHFKTPENQQESTTVPALQLYMCIDDRECSFRRHVEQRSTTISENFGTIETFGIAGFFGIPIKYKPVDGREMMILAPEQSDPSAIMIEGGDDFHHGEVRKYNKRRKFLGNLNLFYEQFSFSPIGSVAMSLLLGPWSLVRLWMMGFAPNAKQNIREKFNQHFVPKPHTDFDLPISPEVAATLLSRTFKDIGTQNRFAPIIIVLGHGAVSTNNPFSAAYNCGACGGRHGGPNARLLARLANDESVRECLRKEHNVSIPKETIFIGGLHNTTNDTIDFYDIERLSATNLEKFEKAKSILDRARGLNALERCQRFLLATKVFTPEQALEHVRIRATDTAEIRPELNHATNAAVVVGRRELTRDRFLDRRVFLPSYDPFGDDEKGTNLEHVLGPALLVCSGINLEYLFSTINVEQHGAGTKAPLNVVSNVGVMQGTSGDLRTGLPSQMTEMHTPVRALYVIDSPVSRLEEILKRRTELRQLIHNEWVRCVVRDPFTNQFYRFSNRKFLPIQNEEELGVSDDQLLRTQFKHHRLHGMSIARKESFVYWCANFGMISSCILPMVLFGSAAMNPFGNVVAISSTLLALPILAFSKRYLHGEFMFTRFSALSVGLLLGFNLVALAPSLELAMLGWSLFGFSSTFLIGAYNERPSVRNNATFAFAIYRISDFALLISTAFGGMHAISSGHVNGTLVACGLLVAALLKSSQFPLTALFVRSMEGPTPASALGYAGLSAHVGVVLLAGTMPLWFDFEWARIVLASIGGYTAIFGTLLSKVRADRKGSIARATSSTLGMIFVILAMGYPKLALTISLGHAAFRMIQILRAPNAISDSQNLQSAIGAMPWPKIVPDWLFRFSWRMRRLDTEFHFLHFLHSFSARLHISNKKKWNLSKIQQWALTSVCVVLAGAPFTPFSHYLDELLIEMLPTHPFVSSAIMFGHVVFSVVLMRFVFVHVLYSGRFKIRNNQKDSKE